MADIARLGVLSRDTSAEAERVQIEIWRRMTPEQKLAIVDQASCDAATLALAGIRQRHPDASERECFLRLAEIRLGPELVRNVYADAESLLGPMP